MKYRKITLKTNEGQCDKKERIKQGDKKRLNVTYKETTDIKRHRSTPKK